MILLQKLELFFNFSKYAIIFIGCIVEGPIVMMTSGFLWRFGQFDLVPMYLALMSGDFVADIGWYFVGRHGARGLIDRFGRYVGITDENIIRVEKLFQKYQNRILILSKLTAGFGFATVILMVAGMLRVPFKRYV